MLTEMWKFVFFNVVCVNFLLHETISDPKFQQHLFSQNLLTFRNEKCGQTKSETKVITLNLVTIAFCFSVEILFLSVFSLFMH